VILVDGWVVDGRRRGGGSGGDGGDVNDMIIGDVDWFHVFVFEFFFFFLVRFLLLLFFCLLLLFYCFGVFIPHF